MKNRDSRQGGWRAARLLLPGKKKLSAGAGQIGWELRAETSSMSGKVRHTPAAAATVPKAMDPAPTSDQGRRRGGTGRRRRRGSGAGAGGGGALSPPCKSSASGTKGSSSSHPSWACSRGRKGPPRPSSPTRRSDEARSLPPSPLARGLGWVAVAVVVAVAPCLSLLWFPLRGGGRKPGHGHYMALAPRSRRRRFG